MKTGPFFQLQTRVCMCLYILVNADLTWQTWDASTWHRTAENSMILVQNVLNH